MRVVVTGAGGVLGRHLVGALAARGDEVLAVSSQRPDALQASWAAHGAPDAGLGVQVVATAAAASGDVLRGVDAVFDCAFPRNVGGHALAEGMRFHAGFFAGCERAGVGRVIDVSSQSVYDSARTAAAVEGDSLVLDTPYATAKYSVEMLADALLPTTVHVHTRLASLIGVALSQRLVNRFAARVLAGDDITLTGGDQVFDFMDVRDAASALIALGDYTPTTDCDIVNVGAGTPRTLYEIATAVVSVVNDIAETTATVDVATGGESTYVSSELDVSRLRNHTGFRPQFSLAHTTADIVDDLRGRGS